MIPVLATFDMAFLEKSLKGDFHVHPISRFPFLDLKRIHQKESLIFLLCEGADFEKMESGGESLLFDQITEEAKTKRLVLVLLPDQEPASPRWSPPRKTEALQKLKNEKNVYVFEIARLLPLFDQPVFQPQMQYLAGCRYSREFLSWTADWLRNLADFHFQRQKKLLIVDLDEVLWGGILSEVGWQNLQVDQADPLGKSFLGFQLELRKAKDLGYVIAVCSRNYQDEVKKAFSHLSHLPMKIEDFVFLSADWRSKDLQVSEICEKLRILEKDVVFFDDDPHERDLIRKTHPEILVADLPHSPYERPNFLRRLIGTENPFGSQEDLSRTQSYIQNVEREKARNHFSDFSSWLSSMEARLTAAPYSEENGERLVQLLNKTNQFNLRPAQRSIAELEARRSEPEHQLFAIRYRDKLADDGIIGVVAFVNSREEFLIHDFVLSCRVFGRGLEDAMMSWLFSQAKMKNDTEVQIAALETGRNRIGFEFLSRLGAIKLKNDLYSLKGAESKILPAIVLSLEVKND